MKFTFTVFEIPTDKEIKSFEKEFNNYEEADMWARENYQIDFYCIIDE